jgi:hypothetical protein
MQEIVSSLQFFKVHYSSEDGLGPSGSLGVPRAVEEDSDFPLPQSEGGGMDDVPGVVEADEAVPAALPAERATDEVPLPTPIIAEDSKVIPSPPTLAAIRRAATETEREVVIGGEESEHLSIEEIYQDLGSDDEAIEVSPGNPLFAGEIVTTFEVDGPEHSDYASDIGERAAALTKRTIPVGLPTRPIDTRLRVVPYKGQPSVGAEYLGYSEGTHQNQLFMLDRNYWYGMSFGDPQLRVVEVHEGQDEVLVLAGGHEGFHAAAMEYAGFKTIPPDSLLATIDEGFATAGGVIPYQTKTRRAREHEPSKNVGITGNGNAGH